MVPLKDAWSCLEKLRGTRNFGPFTHFRPSLGGTVAVRESSVRDLLFRLSHFLLQIGHSLKIYNEHCPPFRYSLSPL